MKKDIFEKEYLKSIGYATVKDDGVYGEAHSIRPKGKIILNWNREGASVDYFGDKLEKNSFLGIKNDAGTRTCFNGIVYDRSDLEKVLNIIV